MVTVEEEQDSPAQVQLSGRLHYSPTAQAVCFAYLHGILQLEPGSSRPTHVPFALRPSRFPRSLFQHAFELCPDMMRLMDKVSRDHQFLQAVLEGPAAAAAQRGSLRMQRLLGLLSLNPQPLQLAIARMDFMCEEGWLQLVEINTISAAFTATAPKVQQMHHQALGNQGSHELPEKARDERAVARTLLAAHRKVSVNGAGTILFVVLEQEHLLCENLLEQAVYDLSGAAPLALTLPGCATRLSLGPGNMLLLDGETQVTVVYFRGGISSHCFCEQGWAARELIERSDAIKCPTIGWLLAGSKAVQTVLSQPGAVAARHPQNQMSSQLQMVFPECRFVGTDPEFETAALREPHKWILKAERGIWIDDDLVHKLEEARSDGGPATDLYLTHKIQPKPVPGVNFVREGRVAHVGPGIQELGLYGALLGSGEEEDFAECAGYLVRTKPEEEADGGVCRGVAVLDSVILDDDVA